MPDRASASLFVAGRILLGIVVFGCGGGEPSEPSLGALRIEVATGGEGLDPDGYVISLDGQPGASVGPQQTLSLPALSPGSHTMGLTGIAANCALDGPNPRAVTVAARDTADVSLRVTCQLVGLGSLRVTAQTSGTSVDPDGYGITLDGTIRQSVDVTGAASLLDIAPGSRNVGLVDLAGTCSVDGANPRPVTITADQEAAVAFVVTCTTGTPVSRHRIVFVSSRADQVYQQLYSVSPDGSNPVQLTSNPATHEMPLASPDGSRILYYESGAGESLINADGSGRRPGPGISGPYAWSPDGTRIAGLTSAADDGSDSVVTAAADGTGRLVLTSDRARHGRPSWSPDGSRLAVQAGQVAGDGAPDILVLHADGSGATNITSSPAYDLAPAWSPDGARIAFISNAGGAGEGLYLINPDGGEVTLLAAGCQGDQPPQWSPDGTALLCLRSSGLGTLDVVVLQADGSGETVLPSNHPVAGTLSWSPDGRQITFQGGSRKPDVFAVNLDGSGLVNVTNDPSAAYQPVWLQVP